MNFLAMFVETGQEKARFTETAMGARYHVGDYFFVSVPEMRLAVDIVDRGRDVEFLCGLVFLIHSSSNCAEPQTKAQCSDAFRFGWFKGIRI